MIQGLNVYNQIAVNNYKHEMLEMLKLCMPQLTIQELSEAIDYSIYEDATDHKATIHNSYKNRKAESSVWQVTQYILERKPIMTSYGCLFQRHGTMTNPLAWLSDSYFKERKILKKKMFEWKDKNIELYERYNLAQTFTEPREVTL